MIILNVYIVYEMIILNSWDFVSNIFISNNYIIILNNY